MILSKLNINSNNDKILASLSFVIFMPLLLDFIAGLTMEQSSIWTTIIYGVSFVVIFIVGRFRIRLRNFKSLLIFYSICFFNIVVFPESQKFFETAQLIILFYYIPISFLLFRTIRSWDNFVPIMFLLAPIAILMGLYILLFTTISSSDSSITYMEFSYALLPFVCVSYAFYLSKRRIIGFLLFLVGLIEMFSFGCRGAIVSSMVFVLISTFFNSKQKTSNVFLLSMLIVIVALNISSIFNYVLNLSFFENSYVLKRAINEELFESETRRIILENCERRLSSMDMEISGLFGDRPYCGSVYPHNIVYEILMQWGWILGSIFLIYMAFLFIKGFVHNENSRFITIFFTCTILLRFFVSGSYLNSGLFWLMIACMLSIIRSEERVVINQSMSNK